MRWCEPSRYVLCFLSRRTEGSVFPKRVFEGDFAHLQVRRSQATKTDRNSEHGSNTRSTWMSKQREWYAQNEKKMSFHVVFLKTTWVLSREEDTRRGENYEPHQGEIDTAIRTDKQLIDRAKSWLIHVSWGCDPRLLKHLPNDPNSLETSFITMMSNGSFHGSCFFRVLMTTFIYLSRSA